MPENKTNDQPDGSNGDNDFQTSRDESPSHLQLLDITSDELHQAAFASLDIGVWRFDLQRQKITWDSEVERIVGCKPSESPEDVFFSLMHSEDRPQAMAEFQKSLHQRQQFRLEYRLLRIDGTVRWMVTTGQPYFDHDGRPTHFIGTVRDITEQKWSEQWLKAQNDVLRSIAQGTPALEVFQAIVDLMRSGLDIAMVALFLSNGNKLRLTAGANIPAGFVEAVELLSLKNDNCIYTESLSKAVPIFSDSASTDERLWPFQKIIEQRGWGSCFTFPVHGTSDPRPMPTCDIQDTQTQQVVGLFAIFRSQRGCPSDRELERVAQAAHLAKITLVRDHTHQSLLESEQRFRELANAMPQLVWTADAQGICNYGNRLLKETIGETALVDWISAVHPDDRQTVIDCYIEAMRTGQPYTAEHRLWNQNVQDYRWVLARSVPSRDANGEIQHWYGAATDIEDLKRTEAELREERDRLSAIASICPSVLFSGIEHADGAFSLPYAAASIGDLLGDESSKIQRDVRCLIERIDPDDFARTQQLYNEASAKMSALETAFQIQHPTKGTVWVECRASPLRLADGRISWHGTLTDVTRRKVLEKRLLQSEKLEAIGRLAGGIAHDFNNMLTVIIGACHVLEITPAVNQFADSHAIVAAKENIETIRQAALRAAALTKQLLAFSRQQPSAPQQLNLNVVIAQAEGILARLVGESIELETRLAADLKPVFVDPSQVEQILVNLIVNSRDAIAGNGHIQILTRNVIKMCDVHSATQSQEPKPFVEIIVSDDGCGMSTETLQRIFDPFFTTKPIGKGTGLGLAVVHGIVTQNGGSIEVESQVDGGTLIHIFLPAIEVTESADAVPRRFGPLEGGTEGVLVVDDERAIGEMTAKNLRSLGYTVFVAGSPDEAEQLFASNADAIDVLLTDLLMPRCNGVELANELTARKANLRVVVMSGHRTASFDNADVARTNYRFLPKPYTTIELSDAIRSVIAID